ncbi:hypothetical protein ACWDR0_16610 [Streptomyces sp. NPDC003691]
MLGQEQRQRQRIMAGLLVLTLALGLMAMSKRQILQYLDSGLLNTWDDCAATGPLEREIDALPFFTVPPAGTVPAKGQEAPGGGAGCLDDSGDEFVSAHRTYRFTGDKQTVADRFRAAAEADGWRRGPVVSGDQDEYEELDPVDPSDLCFDKRLENGQVVVYVSFLPAKKHVEVDAYSSLDGTASVC